MVSTEINGRWKLLLPEHRADRPQWPYWEAARLAAEHNVIAGMSAKMFYGAPLVLRRRPVVADVGTEEGDLSGLYALWGASVALFEPNPRVWPNIKVIWEANMLARPVRTFVGFAGPISHLREPLDDLWAGWPPCASGPIIGDHGFMNLCERDPEAAQVIRLDDALERVDMITIDVEGAELSVLRGSTRLFQTCKPVVFISMHPAFMMDMYEETPHDIQQLMESYGYFSTHLGTDHEEHWLWQHPDNTWLKVGR